MIITEWELKFLFASTFCVIELESDLILLPKPKIETANV
jgi:hypothetical protein